MEARRGTLGLDARMFAFRYNEGRGSSVAAGHKVTRLLSVHELPLG